MPAKSPEALERKNAKRRARYAKANPPPANTPSSPGIKLRLFFRPHQRQMSKSELRDMYANAAANTAKKG